MQKITAVILCTLCILAANVYSSDETASAPDSTVSSDVISIDIVTISVEQQHDFVNPHSKSALAVRFQLKENWHFYASAETAPGGMNLKLSPSSDKDLINFSEPIFPHSQLYFDKALGIKLNVFSDNFTVYLPFRAADIKTASTEDILEGVQIAVEGAVCSDIQCRVPDFDDLSTEIRISFGSAIGEDKFTLPDLKEPPRKGSPSATNQWASYSTWFALGLAFLAGLILNIMPCVWPVLPLIVMRIVVQTKQSKGISIVMGLAFCLGILLFFASLAGANIILRIFYGTVLQWGDQFRNPAFIAGMALLLIVLALFMFGLFTISVPSSIAGKSGSGKGYSGAIGMGFLAAILSTPCSFGILAAAFAWAQAQPLLPATVAIMIIGVGMAMPYAVLTSMPGLLKRLPKAGRWMELFKQAIGFVLLVIAVKLITALPETRRMGMLYFALILAFCIWMWSVWVSYNTKLIHKWLIRILAVVLAVAGGWVFLPAPADELIDWQHYDEASIQTALTQQRPVLIEFMADWCLSCKTVEKIVYSRKDIAELIEQKGVLAIKADTTEKDFPATLALKNTYNEPGVPVSMLFVPGEKEPVKWRGILFADELKKLLESLRAQRSNLKRDQ